MSRDEAIYDRYLAWTAKLGISANGTAERETYEKVAQTINSLQMQLAPRRGVFLRSTGGGD